MPVFGNGGKVLIVMPTAFRFGWMGATQRLFQIAEAFHKIGFDVALLAGKTTILKVQPNIDAQFPGLVFRTQHSGAYPRLLDQGMLPRRVCRALWKAHGPDYYSAQVSFGWAKSLNIMSVIEELAQKGFKPNIIWGVSTGYLDGPYAVQRISEALSVPWIFELHDSPHWVGNSQDRTAVCRKFQRLLFSSSRQVVTSEAYRRILIEDFGLKEKQVHTIHLSYDGDIEPEENKMEHMQWRLLYAGTFGAGRNLKPLAYALHRAIAREPLLFDNFLVDLVGEGEGLLETEKLVESLKIKDFFSFHGSQSKEYCDELSSESDILIVIQTVETSKQQIPGKLFNCLKFAKPILAIMPECEAADILRRSGLGSVHASEDVDGIAKTLIRLGREKHEGRFSVKINFEYISQFSTKKLPEKLILVTRGLV